jgi:hypothetical protein
VIGGSHPCPFIMEVEFTATCIDGYFLRNGFVNVPMNMSSMYR